MAKLATYTLLTVVALLATPQFARAECAPQCETCTEGGTTQNDCISCADGTYGTSNGDGTNTCTDCAVQGQDDCPNAEYSTCDGSIQPFPIDSSSCGDCYDEFYRDDNGDCVACTAACSGDDWEAVGCKESATGDEDENQDRVCCGPDEFFDVASRSCVTPGEITDVKCAEGAHFDEVTQSCYAKEDVFCPLDDYDYVIDELDAQCVAWQSSRCKPGLYLDEQNLNCHSRLEPTFCPLDEYDYVIDELDTQCVAWQSSRCMPGRQLDELDLHCYHTEPTFCPLDEYDYVIDELGIQCVAWESTRCNPGLDLEELSLHCLKRDSAHCPLDDTDPWAFDQLPLECIHCTDIDELCIECSEGAICTACQHPFAPLPDNPTACACDGLNNWLDDGDEGCVCAPHTLLQGPNCVFCPDGQYVGEDASGAPACVDCPLGCATCIDVPAGEGEGGDSSGPGVIGMCTGTCADGNFATDVSSMGDRDIFRCTPWTECTVEEWEFSAPSPLVDRVCYPYFTVTGNFSVFDVTVPECTTGIPGLVEMAQENYCGETEAESCVVLNADCNEFTSEDCPLAGVEVTFTVHVKTTQDEATLLAALDDEDNQAAALQELQRLYPDAELLCDGSEAGTGGPDGQQTDDGEFTGASQLSTSVATLLAAAAAIAALRRA